MSWLFLVLDFMNDLIVFELLLFKLRKVFNALLLLSELEIFSFNLTTKVSYSSLRLEIGLS